MNDLSRSLRNRSAFSQVVTDSDLLKLRSGWRIEKHIECKVRDFKSVDGNELALVLSLEVSCPAGEFLVSASSSVSGSEKIRDVFIGSATDCEGINRALINAIEKLDQASGENGQAMKDLEEAMNDR
jgi:hypothetical protein